MSTEDDAHLSSLGEISDSEGSISELLVGPEDDISPTISVILPTLNEEVAIAECIEAIETAVYEMGVPTEIIVSDSSTDRTPEIAREMGAIVVEPDKNGYGYAYRYAFERARGEYIVMGDADATYDFEELPKLLNALMEENADIAIGSRFQGEIKKGAMPWLHRYIGNPLLTKFLNKFYDVNVTDAYSNFRVIHREALDDLDLRSYGMEFAGEMIMNAAVKEMKIVELPITYHKRKGESTLNSFRDGWRHLEFIFMNAPSYLFSTPAILSILIGVLILTASFLPTIGSETFGPEMTIGGSLLTIVGYQIGAFSLFSSFTNPIKKPRDPFVTWMNFQLEHGMSIGGILVISGITPGIYLWMTDGAFNYPFVNIAIVLITLVFIGIQTIFGSLYLSIISYPEITSDTAISETSPTVTESNEETRSSEEDGSNYGSLFPLMGITVSIVVVVSLVIIRYTPIVNSIELSTFSYSTIGFFASAMYVIFMFYRRLARGV